MTGIGRGSLAGACILAWREEFSYAEIALGGGGQEIIFGVLETRTIR